MSKFIKPNIADLEKSRGIIYVMTTAVSGLIKIGQTGSNNYKERMRNLEANGYYPEPLKLNFVLILSQEIG